MDSGVTYAVTHGRTRLSPDHMITAIESVGDPVVSRCIRQKKAPPPGPYLSVDQTTGQAVAT
jgi:hypothetical protein